MLDRISKRGLSVCALACSAGIVSAAPTTLPGLTGANGSAVTAQYVYDHDLSFKYVMGGRASRTSRGPAGRP